MTLSTTAIEQQKISQYPVFSDAEEFSYFSLKPKKRHLHIVNKTTSEILDTDIGEFDEFDDATPIYNIGSFGTQTDISIKCHEKNSSEKINSDRLKLLAKKYAQNSFAREDDARLSIVTEKIRQLMPRVTIDDFEQLAEIAEEISRINGIDNELRIELGV